MAVSTTWTFWPQGAISEIYYYCCDINRCQNIKLWCVAKPHFPTYFYVKYDIKGSKQKHIICDKCYPKREIEKVTVIYIKNECYDEEMKNIEKIIKQKTKQNKSDIKNWYYIYGR